MKPTLEQVRDVIAAMMEKDSIYWIGEGRDIAEELLAYIDGESPNTPDEWKKGLDDWVYLVTDADGFGDRGPFESRQKAEAWLAEIPEQGICPSQWGKVAPRASYRILTRAQYRASHES